MTRLLKCETQSCSPTYASVRPSVFLNTLTTRRTRASSTVNHCTLHSSSVQNHTLRCRSFSWRGRSSHTALARHHLPGALVISAPAFLKVQTGLRWLGVGLVHEEAS